MKRQAAIKGVFSSCLLFSQLRTISQIRRSRQLQVIQVNRKMLILVMSGFDTGSSEGQKEENLRQQQQSGF